MNTTRDNCPYKLRLRRRLEGNEASPQATEVPPPSQPVIDWYRTFAMFRPQKVEDKVKLHILHLHPCDGRKGQLHLLYFHAEQPTLPMVNEASGWMQQVMGLTMINIDSADEVKGLEPEFRVFAHTASFMGAVPTSRHSIHDTPYQMALVPFSEDFVKQLHPIDRRVLRAVVQMLRKRETHKAFMRGWLAAIDRVIKSHKPEESQSEEAEQPLAA